MFFPVELARLGFKLAFLFVRSHHPWYIRWIYFQMRLMALVQSVFRLYYDNFSRLWHGSEQTASLEHLLRTAL